jgi:2-oxoglutarate ferredoxin oxidoreductase subunit alpha
VILLMDKQLSEIHGTFEKTLPPKIERWVILENPSDGYKVNSEGRESTLGYKRYELTADWVSPRVVVWTKNWDFISTSYEHDEFGATTESSEMKKLMTEKRFKKLENFFKKEWISGYELINEKAKKLIVTMWPNSYVAKEFIRENPEFGLLIVKILKPIDETLLEIFKNREELIFVESNYSGQLENYLVKELWLKFIPNLKIKNLRKYDLYPFYIEDFENIK